MTDFKIKKVLIANRGEIAGRIRRACDALQISSVLAVSDPDKTSLAAREAAETFALGGASARDSYLDIGKIIDAARNSGCDAIHPGYGFLSENAEFAQAVKDAGLCFIGPSPESIRSLGSKPNARKAVTAVGVPVTPGSEGACSDKELLARAKEIGVPLIVKAAAGGGGRGMRIIRDLSTLEESLISARQEALKNFSSDEVYLEKFIEEPRHVEVQLFGDKHGNVVHFGTRDCSAQRRHQKLVEEAPAPFLSDAVREKIHAAAVSAAKSVGYYNAGTAEFLVKDDQFYFLEINTRIQVEHPVTEAITGVDLVQLQIKIAQGEKLPFTQEQILFNGHAIEFRINAEDPLQNFRPATGKITGWRRESSVEAREDIGYEAGDTVPPYYDSLLSKVIIHRESRAATLSAAYEFFKTYRIEGIPTSSSFHRWILAVPQFQEVGIDIGYVERNFNAESIREVDLLSQKDPAYVESKDGVYFTELVTVTVKDELRKIEIVHEPHGVFLAIPLTKNGEQEAKGFWRRSTQRGVAIQGVVSSLPEFLVGARKTAY